jgi:hypothetical protein
MKLFFCAYLEKATRGIVNMASAAAQWPNNIVPYILDGTFTSADRAIIAAVRICMCKIYIPTFISV